MWTCVFKKKKSHDSSSKPYVFCLDCFQAQVLYDFAAEPGNNELTVKEGETITITNQVNCATFLLLSVFALIQNFASEASNFFFFFFNLISSRVFVRELHSWFATWDDYKFILTSLSSQLVIFVPQIITQNMVYDRMVLNVYEAPPLVLLLGKNISPTKAEITWSDFYFSSVTDILKEREDSKGEEKKRLSKHYVITDSCQQFKDHWLCADLNSFLIYVCQELFFFFFLFQN